MRAPFPSRKSSRRAACPRIAAVVASAALASAPLAAQEPVDTAVARRIMDEATQRSQVMEYAFQLTDVRGPRLAGSPGFKAAGTWVLGQLRAMGLAAVRAEPIDFGRGWEEQRFELRLVEPGVLRIPAVAIPYSRATAGEVTAAPMFAPLPRADASAEAFERWFAAQRGRLRGRILLASDTIARVSERKTRWFGGRPTDDELRTFHARLERVEDAEEQAAADSGRPVNDAVAEARRGRAQEARQRRVDEFLRAEGVAAVLYQSNAFGGAVNMFSAAPERTQTTAGRFPGYPWPPASAIVGHEHYGRLVRLLARGVPARVAMRLDAAEHRDPAAAFNVLGELPGTTRRDEVVLIGAHLDSWNAATGATDNAAGVAIMLEAMRILQALGVRPARTIRLALWGAHESTGGLGIRTYVRDHLVAGYPAHWMDDTVPRAFRPRPEHARHAAYFNLDHGGGRIRGVFLERNLAVRPVFEAWGRAIPQAGTFHLPNVTSYGTDTPKIGDEGVPAFQFVQDGAESLVRPHHSTMDLYDFLVPADLRHSAAVVAFFAYQTAMREDGLPRANTRSPRPIPD